MKALSGKRFAKLLQQHDWTLAHVNGNHHIYTKPGVTPRISLPVHGHQALQAGLQQHLMVLTNISAVEL